MSSPALRQAIRTPAGNASQREHIQRTRQQADYQGKNYALFETGADAVTLPERVCNRAS